MSSLFELNAVTISGNLTRDPELRHTLSDTAVCNIRIAHNDRRQTSSGEWTDHPQFFNIAIWAAIGEWAATHLAKGDKVIISGRLRWNEYQDSDGVKHQLVDISAERVIPVPRRHPAVERAADGDDIEF